MIEAIAKENDLDYMSSDDKSKRLFWDAKQYLRC